MEKGIEEMIVHVEAKDLRIGDKIVETHIEAKDLGGDLRYTQFSVKRAWFRPGHLWYIARKYFRMNPTKLWWTSHVEDHIYFMLQEKKQPCYLREQGKCVFCE